MYRVESVNRVKRMTPPRVLRRFAVVALVALSATGAWPSMSSDVAAAGAEPCSPEWLRGATRLGGVAAQQPGVAPMLAGPAAQPPQSGVDGRFVSSAQAPASPNASALPNDELYWAGQQNSLRVMRALDAWETTFGGGDVTVAVIAEGVDIAHPDLDGRIWRNGRELANGRDDDGNGYVDDVHGWDFGDGDGDLTPVGVRGTLLAGIVGAETNNRIGVAAVNWQARVMPLKVYKAYPNPSGGQVIGAYPEDFTRSVCYATNNGARIILFSYFNFLGVQSAAADLERLRVAIDYAYDHGVLTIAPAGECAIAKSWCPDAATYGSNPPIYPAVFNNVVGVQAFRPGGELRESASFGPWVDITAPGEGYYTTKLPDQDGEYYYIKSATAVISDFAAAQVAGVVGLMMSVNPDYSLDNIQQTLCDGAFKDQGGPYDGGRNDRYGCGKLSAERAVESMPWKLRVMPHHVTALTDGSLPGPSRDLVNPYLNAINWEVRPEVPWIRTLPLTQQQGGPSVATVNADLAAVPTGMLQAGRVYTETLHACTVGNIVVSCQDVTYELRFVAQLTRVLLPAIFAGGP